MNLFKTKGIVLSQIKYGDTSLICAILTETFGLQKYLVKGVRTSKTKTKNSNILQPGFLLEMIVYHNPLANLQYIKDYNCINHLTSAGIDIWRNCLLIFGIEISMQYITENQPVPELFAFLQNYILLVEEMPLEYLTNLAMYFVIESAKIAGYQFQGVYSEQTAYINIAEGSFVSNNNSSSIYGTASLGNDLFKALSCKSINDYIALKISNHNKRELIHCYLDFLQLHAVNFKPLKCLPILETIVS